MKNSTLLTSFIGLFLITNTTLSFGSGSFSGSGADSASGMYNRGKVVVYKKLICDTCPLSANKLDESTAKNILGEIKGDGQAIRELSQIEKQAALTYLNKRFGQ